MPFVPVPKDLTKVKTKVAFNLTKRQLICFGGGAMVGIPTYIFTRGSIGNDAAVLLMIGLMLPLFLFGIYEKDGQHLEQVLGHFVRAQFIRPPNRPYQTENIYAALERQNLIDKEAARREQYTAKKAGAKASAGTKAASLGKGGAAGSHSSDARRKTHRR